MSKLPREIQGRVQTGKISQDIESKADYYEPSIYSALSFFHTLRLDDDSLGRQFVPLSPTWYKLGNDKSKGLMFVVGLIPPSSNITGRLLDRSATVRARLGLGGNQNEEVNLPPVSEPQSPSNTDYRIRVSKKSAKVEGEYPTGSNLNCSANDGIAVRKDKGKRIVYNDDCVTNLTPKQLYQAMYEAYVAKFGHPPTATECQFLAAQCWRETSGILPGNNPGYIGNYYKKPEEGDYFGLQDYKNGRTRVRWFRKYPTVAAGLADYLGIIARNPRVLTAAQQGDALAYMEALASVNYYGEPVYVYYNKNKKKGQGFPGILSLMARAVPEAGLGDGKNLPVTTPDSCAYNETSRDYQKRVKGIAKPGTAAATARFTRDSIYDENCSKTVEEQGGQADSWQQTAQEAQKSKKAEAKKRDASLERKLYNKQLMDAQARFVEQSMQAYETMAKMPPLRLLINPTSFSVSSEKVINDGDRSRSQYIVQHWGDAQDKISGSGTVGGFFAIDALDGRMPGLNRTARNYSASYQNLLSLWLLYRNNAAIYLPDPTTGSTSLSTVGSVYLYYDNTLYIGNFESFNISETGATPFSVTYDFSFVVHSSYLLDRSNTIVDALMKQQYVQEEAKAIPTTRQAHVERTSPFPEGDPMNLFGPDLSGDTNGS